jgi:hypothetical protein
MLATAERAHAIDRLVSSNVAPLDWHVWAGAVRESEEVRGGGTSGVADTAFFAAVDRYMDAQHAPPAARASIDFIHGLAGWDFARASRAADLLVPIAIKGDLWMPADELREGAVVARLKIGDVRGARAALDQLAPRTVRDVNDVRPQLLAAWVAIAEKAKRVAPATAK